MARRSDHTKDELTQLVLTAAEKIVDLEGLPGMSARKIAREIGYTVGTLYLVFANLDDLILHVNARTLDLMYSDLREATGRCRNPKTCIMAIGRAYVEFAVKYPNRWKMVFEHSLPEGSTVPDWFTRKVVMMFELIERHVSQLLAHQPRKKISQSSRTLWCGVHGICALAITGKLDAVDSNEIQAHTDLLIINFLAGMTECH